MHRNDEEDPRTDLRDYGIDDALKPGRLPSSEDSRILVCVHDDRKSTEYHLDACEYVKYDTQPSTDGFVPCTDTH